MARLLQTTLNNAWGATPLFWYSELDGRSPRNLLDAIMENQDNMAWHGKRNIPFEVNESHHWSLRSAPDAVAVAAAFLAAYNAKRAGVKHYISQLMFDTPLGISPRFDLAKMFAKIEMIEGLHDPHFKSYRQVRTGLFSFPEDPWLAKGALASSIQNAMFVSPHIVHVVSYCEADHAATATEVIQSTKIARKVVAIALKGLPDISKDAGLSNHTEQLTADASSILQAIRNIADASVDDPLCHAPTLTKAVQLGILDAPHLKGASAAPGTIQTAIVDGKCLTVDPDTYNPVSELDRINEILRRDGFLAISRQKSNGISTWT